MSLTKIKITGTIKVKTGLHIGSDGSFSAIGAIVELSSMPDTILEKLADLAR